MAAQCRYLPRSDFARLFTALQAQGYRCVGPRLRDGAIVFDTLQGPQDLPTGWTDEQAPGRYRLRRTDSPRSFAWAVGPQALKPLTFAPRERLWRARRETDGGLSFEPVQPEAPPLAVIGVRACDLAALALQDQHFLHGPCRDPYYAARREALLLVAVHCTRPAETCFCASTGDGPKATQGFDLALHERDAGFLLEAGTQRGARILEALALPAAPEDELAAALAEIEAAAAAQSRALPGRDLREALFANLEHPRWEEVAERCLSCANCTSVCPTCFCHAESDAPDLDGRRSEHLRQWSSCFTAEHSYVGGWTARPDTRLRYRQWLTHKLGGWHDQYGRSGCVGCGRCITWCPAGIDLTEEAGAVCAEDRS